MEVWDFSLVFYDVFDLNLHTYFSKSQLFYSVFSKSMDHFRPRGMGESGPITSVGAIKGHENLTYPVSCTLNDVYSTCDLSKGSDLRCDRASISSNPCVYLSKGSDLLAGWLAGWPAGILKKTSLICLSICSLNFRDLELF